MNSTLLSCLLLLGCSAVPGDAGQAPILIQRPVGGPCDGCTIMYEGMPELSTIRPDVVLAGPDQPGVPLELSGTVLRPDGRTPAKDIVLYLHHTDAQGNYTPAEGQGQGRRHGRHRGWVRTDAEGRFHVRTIRPASYPDSRIPAHIHLFVKEPDKNEYYIDEVRFLDDPLLTPEERAKAPHRGGDLDLAVQQDSLGTWRGRLTILLGRNVPDYP